TWDLQSFLLDYAGSTAEGLARKGQITGGGRAEKSSGVSSYGTVQVAVCGGRIFSCGVDGSLWRSRAPL
ncbi:hypothetical protein HK405_001423, partial [Cladochytrium tenue]